MEYILNPYPIFEDYVIKSNKVKSKNLHYINNKNQLVFKANKKNLPYYDHIETSGLYTSLIYSYGANINKDFVDSFYIVFPTFRKKINDTRGSFAIRIKNPIDILINNKKYEEKLKDIKLDGLINITSNISNVKVNKTIYCSNTFKGIVINYKLTNISDSNLEIKIENDNNIINCDDNIYDRKYHVNIILSNDKSLKNNSKINVNLSKNKSISFDVIIITCYDDESIDVNLKCDLLKRKNYIKEISNKYQVITENNILNTMFNFSKIRASESICLTKNGLMHSPGGGNYYASTWCNDQCEYASVFFAYLNYELANKAMDNCFSQYIDYMYTEKALVSSIIAEATSYWNGAGDRGDASMYVYGLCKYLLTNGTKAKAKKYVKAIKWCIDYTLKQENALGLYKSDSDELENRFESSNCNLATNSIFYQALIKANILFNELNIKNNYDKIAKKLKDNINKHFYKDGYCIYCDLETHLRSHVVYPLIMEIYDHSDDIVNTIMNKKIYSKNGFKTIDNCNTYWDRVTLMAIRGLFNASYSDLAYDLLINYSNNRLLKDHVPYAIEAYPEGNQAHLAAESALYARIYLEGILGFEQLGFNKFMLKPSIPTKMNCIDVNNVTYNKKTFSIKVNKENENIRIIIDKLNVNLLVKNNEKIIINV